MDTACVHDYRQAGGWGEPICIHCREEHQPHEWTVYMNGTLLRCPVCGETAPVEDDAAP